MIELSENLCILVGNPNILFGYKYDAICLIFVCYYLICRMASCGDCKLHVFHGGEFQRPPNLICSESERSEVQIEPDC